MKTFKDLQPGDKVWCIRNLKDFSSPEFAIVKSTQPNFYLNDSFIEVSLESFIGDSDYTFITTKNSTASENGKFHSNKESAVLYMLRERINLLKQAYNDRDKINKYITRLEMSINKLQKEQSETFETIENEI